MRYCLLLLLQCLRINSSPLGLEHDDRRFRRDAVIVENEEINVVTTSTPSTFKVERLDAPIERIEIRLIDENSTDVGHSEVRIQPPAVTAKPIIDTGAGAVVNVVEDHKNSNESQQDNYTQEKYKKVEYRSDGDAEVPTSETPRDGELEQITTQSTEDVDDDSLEQPRAIQGKAWATLSQMIPKAGKLVDMEEPELPPEIQDDGNPNEDDEPEPVEECLRNKNYLSTEVAERVKTRAQKLNRMIKKLNKQMKNYCTSDTVEYRSCPIWREEKMVHYYRLMRLTYCSDYNQWPDATRVKRQYQEVLPLFETLYAFQKTDN